MSADGQDDGETESEPAHDHGAEHGHDESAEGRVTSPMQSYDTRRVGIGFLVFLVGALVTFVLPLVAA